MRKHNSRSDMLHEMIELLQWSLPESFSDLYKRKKLILDKNAFLNEKFQIELIHAIRFLFIAFVFVALAYVYMLLLALPIQAALSMLCAYLAFLNGKVHQKRGYELLKK